MDWDVMNRLHDKGYIGNPKSNAKSVTLSDDGATLQKSYSRNTLACHPDPSTKQFNTLGLCHWTNGIPGLTRYYNWSTCGRGLPDT